MTNFLKCVRKFIGSEGESVVGKIYYTQNIPTFTLWTWERIQEEWGDYHFVEASEEEWLKQEGLFYHPEIY